MKHSGERPALTKTQPSNVTTGDLSGQIGALSRELSGLGTRLSGEIRGVKRDVEGLKETQGNHGLRLNGMSLRIDAMGTAVGEARDELLGEIGLLRQQVVGDHSPRITTLEKTTVRTKAKGAAGVLGIITLVLSLAAEIAASYQHKTAGPLESIAKIAQGLGSSDAPDEPDASAPPAEEQR